MLFTFEEVSYVEVSIVNLVFSIYWYLCISSPSLNMPKIESKLSFQWSTFLVSDKLKHYELTYVSTLKLQQFSNLSLIENLQSSGTVRKFWTLCNFLNYPSNMLFNSNFKHCLRSCTLKFQKSKLFSKHSFLNFFPIASYSPGSARKDANSLKCINSTRSQNWIQWFKFLSHINIEL